MGKIFKLLIVFMLVLSGIAFASEVETLRTDGRYLYTPTEERVILRGVNAMIVYWDIHGEETYHQIRRSGANSVRIFWQLNEPKPSPEDLDITITNAIEEQLIPVIALWGATGDWDNLPELIDYWLRDDIIEILKDHQQYLILNIANEAGDGSETEEEFIEVYSDAIRRLREKGFKAPIMIDANDWGRNEDILLSTGNVLMEDDPVDNLIFSWHPWDTDVADERYKRAIDSSIEQELPFIIGEFSHVGVFCENPINWEFIVEYSHENDIGWLAWVCGWEEDDPHKITVDRNYGNWQEWGEELVVNSPYGIEQTSEIPEYIAEMFPARPDIVEYITDFRLDKSSDPETYRINLDNKFYDQLDGTELEYTVSSSNSELIWGDIEKENILTIDYASGELGKAEISVTAENSAGKISEQLFTAHVVDPVSGDLAFLRSVEASSVKNEFLYNPQNIVDGSFDSYWVSEDKQEEWIYVDLEEKKQIDRVSLIWGDDCAASFEIQVSYDGDSWQKVYREDNGSKGFKTIHLDDVTGKFLKLNMIESGSGDGFAISQLQVYTD